MTPVLELSQLVDTLEVTQVLDLALESLEDAAALALVSLVDALATTRQFLFACFDCFVFLKLNH